MVWERSSHSALADLVRTERKFPAKGDFCALDQLEKRPSTHWKNTKKLAGQLSFSRSAASSSMSLNLIDSPQPQASATLGLRNLKPLSSSEVS